jgi:HD-GYP domain-containing protein (c-di-GMP phosphodiesterase class II)
MDVTTREEYERRLLEQNIQTAQVLGGAIAMRDHDTGSHNLRVALYAGALGEAMELSQQSMRALIAGAFLHDIGKIGIPDRVLLKEGPLSAEEKGVMRCHCQLGTSLLDQLPAFHDAIPVVRHHHERYDGSGYPDALAGENIPLIARAFAVVDVFDALMSARPYKQGFELATALEIIGTELGAHFDPKVGTAFLRLAPRVFQQFGGQPEEVLFPALAKLRLRHFGV